MMDPKGVTSFNPRTPCGVRHKQCFRSGQPEKFQSTHSLRSATDEAVLTATLRTVSIHALLAECDKKYGTERINHHGFNPRTPCGVRQLAFVIVLRRSQFQSTHSLRSATLACSTMDVYAHVSIHALLAECDLSSEYTTPQVERFNPRTPCGVRHAGFKRVADMRWFQSTHSLRSATRAVFHVLNRQEVSIHALLAECDILNGLSFYNGLVSIHALLAECDILLHVLDVVQVLFQSTHSLRSATV